MLGSRRSGNMGPRGSGGGGGGRGGGRHRGGGGGAHRKGCLGAAVALGGLVAGLGYGFAELVGRVIA